jgi:valyl-tRNA synthetase
MRADFAQEAMSGRHLDKTYDPRQVEDRWYRVWVERGYFRASRTHPGEPYTIVIPPPNVTGSLHIGHALNNTIQDILIRWRRMQGRNALWVPGTDHAGIATQNVVERQLAAEGISREQLGREKFVERVWAWKAQSGGTIIGQLKRLGASCDWSRERFTMDEGLSKAVREVFVRLHEEGLIYRGERLINWCPRCLTALSDIEVEHEETTGTLYHIRYPLAEDPTTALIVATTRPETMLGDAAVAVHPEDPRYRHLIGKKVRLPLTTREIPIVGDAILVDREFGTGAVKITPAHDFNDFEAGVRHALPRLVMFDHHAQLDPEGLKAAGVDEALVPELHRLPAAKARATIARTLQARGLLVKTEGHRMALGKCYRCKTVVEPSLSPQWFVKIKPLAKPAIKAVEDGRIRIVPESWVNNYLGWMRDIKDWCISRQIWWGHRIPAWYCTACNRTTMTQTAASASSPRTYTFSAAAKPIVAREAPTQCPTCKGAEFVQDPDVLDTWFSSALWPFSTLGWPEQTPDLATFYPTSTLVTGLDILFFWVARMIMMGLKFMGDVPFREVYIHALVRDAEGQKMSKSKGNVVDPLDVMERYGTDALRFTLASLASPGRDIKLAEERIEGYRNFANKIWNAARFILMNLDGPRETMPPKDRPFADRWILSRLNRTIREVNASLEQYRFDLASGRLYQFIWHEYCDWYLEMIKPALSREDGRNMDPAEANLIRQTLVDTFETIQRLLHPFMPFISEELWQALPHQGDSIVIQPYPVARAEWDAQDHVEQAWECLHQFIVTTRAMRSLLDYQPGKTVEVFGCAQDESSSMILEALRSYIAYLSRATLHVGPAHQWPARNLLRWPVGGLMIGLAVEPDVDLRKALGRIHKELEAKHRESSRIASKLGNPDFTAHAPPEVVEAHQVRLRALEEEHAQLVSSERQLREMMP